MGQTAGLLSYQSPYLPDETSGTLDIFLLSADWLLLEEFTVRGVVGTIFFFFRNFQLRVQGPGRPELQDGGVV